MFEKKNNEKDIRDQSRGNVSGSFSKTPEASTEQEPFHFQHDQQGQKVVSPKRELVKTLHSSFSMPQENFRMKFDIDDLKSCLQSYVSKISFYVFYVHQIMLLLILILYMY